ncbi:S-adenosyl-l-methionine-dependent methyltransferase [Plakobranchus ocellatus]|uniref:S-adenosyl-l-methionine-dependent methyltransferase n=1 Tax=Plakobranchus ocellatus TaxID=259542 RepID=A0AAV4C4T0_9GAST|nr:S-adenosyl-l-methionine-dependent methyltransferase [Plakobranchus ocellatus]
MNNSILASAKDLLSSTVNKTKLYTDMEQSKAYSKNRHQYSDELFKTIVDYCKESIPDLNVAVDVGCGPGSSTLGFAKYFKKVIGVDISESQIACAPKDVRNVEFRVGSSDKLPFIESGSVDLFCAGASFFLMPQKETFAEADRVLRPGGTIAIFGYSSPKTDRPEINHIMENIIAPKVLQFYPKETEQLLDQSRSLELPYPGWIRNDSLSISMNMTVEMHMELIKSSWMAVAYAKAFPGKDLAVEYGTLVKEALEQKSTGPDYTLTYDLFLLMGRKPIG